jgi:hypothetical protein
MLNQSLNYVNLFLARLHARLSQWGQISTTVDIGSECKFYFAKLSAQLPNWQPLLNFPRDMPLLNSYQLIAIIIGSLFFCHQALAGSPKNQAEAFLLSMQSGDIEKAFADLLIESPLVSQSPEKVSNLKAQTKTALTLYGKIKGYDFVSEATLGFSVVKLTYVQKMDSVALVWNFFFYLPKDKWYLSNIELSAWSLAETVQYQNIVESSLGLACSRMWFESWVITARRSLRRMGTTIGFRQPL